MSSNTGSPIYFGYPTTPLKTTATTVEPDNELEQMLSLFHMIASNDYPIDFTYVNDTDVNQTGTRTIKVLVEEIPERA